MQEVPTEEEMLSEINLSDIVLHMINSYYDCWNLCYIMPDLPGVPVRIVVSSVLQMGLMESPAYFYYATDTGRDLAKLLICHKVELPPHPAEPYILPKHLANWQHGDQFAIQA